MESPDPLGLRLPPASSLAEFSWETTSAIYRSSDRAIADPADAHAAARQRKVLLGVNPRSSSAVLIPTAWLSWDLAGVPYIEPCFCSAIVQGYNDHEGRSEAVAKGEKEEGEGYRKWVWDRCAPGKEYRGRMPPHLEVSSAGWLLGLARPP